MDLVDQQEIKFNKQGLVPVITQDESGEVLMLAYADKEALRLTLQTGKAHYFSRSRQKLWLKGETSGNTQEVTEVLVDCDQDAVLYRIKQKGVACHTGNRSCFYRKLK
jgi:phosphoribosyl-AMP cyclohydrolase